MRRSTARHNVALTVLLTTLMTIAVAWNADASIPRGDDDNESFSPLFERRLELGIENLDRPADRFLVANLEAMPHPEVDTPLSGNPLSACLGSGCLLSVCLGSACLNSRCLGSGCIVSACGGSSCVTSGCGGSACVGSTCVGSACVGSTCFGSACLKCESELRRP